MIGFQMHYRILKGASAEPQDFSTTTIWANLSIDFLDKSAEPYKRINWQDVIQYVSEQVLQARTGAGASSLSSFQKMYPGLYS